MIKYEGSVVRQYDDVNTGNAAVGATITVRDNQTGAKLTIYSDDGVTEKSNPFDTDATGS